MIDAELRQPVGFLAPHSVEDTFEAPGRYIGLDRAVPGFIQDRDPGDETEAPDVVEALAGPWGRA